MLSPHTSAPVEPRKLMKADGLHAALDVARRLCGDVRLLPLVMDLNPELPVKGPIPAGTVVVIPSRAEARAFARRHGFSVGFDEKGTNGTDARRRWQAHVGGARIEVAVANEAQRLHPRAQQALHGAANLLQTTLRAGGAARLLEALARDAVAARRVAEAIVLAPRLCEALLELAPRVGKQLSRARHVAAMERGARDLALSAERSLAPLVAALNDGVDPLGGGRAAALGVEAEAEALRAHLETLLGALRKAEDGLSRAPIAAVRALAQREDGSQLPRPWPLLCRVAARLAALASMVPMTALDDGLAGLLPRAATAAGPSLSVAELLARAAGCARAADEGLAFAERLSPNVIALFDAMRPPPVVDGGSATTRRARRRAAFELAVSAHGAVSGQGIAALVGEAVDRAAECNLKGAWRLRRLEREALRQVAQALTGPLSVARRPLSELGRALVIVALALDAELCQGIGRETGREAFVATACKHASRVVSYAACKL